MLECLEPLNPCFNKFSFSATAIHFAFTPTSTSSSPSFISLEKEKMSTSSSDNSPSLARSRWGLLQQAIIKKTIPEPVENPASKRVFERYSKLVGWTTDVQKAVMNVQICVPLSRIIMRSTEKGPMTSILRNFHHRPENGPGGENKLKMTANVNQKNFEYCSALYTIQLCRRNPVVPVNIQNLKGFDKTGRICIWPSEQILAYWALRNLPMFEGKKVIEIGGGFHCMAGLMLAKYSAAAQVVLTDGDIVNVGDVSYSIEGNAISSKLCQGTTLRWGIQGMKPELKYHFDIVIAADVVYEVGTFSSLLETIWMLLKPGGQFILFNPTRDGMLAKFVTLTQQLDNKTFGLSEVKWNEHYDSYVTDLTYQLKKNNPAFNKDWHYPNQVILKKASFVSGLECAAIINDQSQ